MEWIWPQIHSSPNYFRLSVFLYQLDTCLKRYSLALDLIRGGFGSSPTRSLIPGRSRAKLAPIIWMTMSCILASIAISNDINT